MKAIVLAGGNGTRLGYLTSSVSKHLLPIYDKPMIFYSIAIAMMSGVRDIGLVVKRDDLAAYKKLLRNGSHLGISICYFVQEQPLGIAHGMKVAVESWCGSSEPLLVILGDNLCFGHGLIPLLNSARHDCERGSCVQIGYQVEDPQQYGVIEFDTKGQVSKIVEKPSAPASDVVATGIYFFPKDVSEALSGLTISGRGEYESVDVVNQYVDQGRCLVRIMGRGIFWFDCGSIENLYETQVLIRSIQFSQGFLVCCLEEIAIRAGWIDFEQTLESEKTPDHVKAYLKKVLNSRGC